MGVKQIFYCINFSSNKRGIVSAQNVAFQSEKGFRVENEGGVPDVEVEQRPELVIKGGDLQLEKSIKIVINQLKENPPKKVARPPYPNKTNNQYATYP